MTGEEALFDWSFRFHLTGRDAAPETAAAQASVLRGCSALQTDSPAKYSSSLIGIRTNGSGDFLIEVLQEGDELPLPLAAKALPVDTPAAGVECREQVQGAIPTVLVLYAVEYAAGLCPLGGLQAWARLERGLLVKRQELLVRLEETGIELD
jgi:hypothetical protein